LPPKQCIVPPQTLKPGYGSDDTWDNKSLEAHWNATTLHKSTFCLAYW